MTGVTEDRPTLSMLSESCIGVLPQRLQGLLGQRPGIERLLHCMRGRFEE